MIKHSYKNECKARDCQEADGYQCDDCGHYFPRSAVVLHDNGDAYCRGNKGHNRLQATREVAA